MKLKSLKLENFRNYKNLNLDLSDGVTIFLGENAQGKTNLLESIAFLALGKSFRAGNFMEVLGWERPHGRIKGTLDQDGKEKSLEVFFEREPRRKKIKKQGKISDPKDFIGTFKVVLFTPDSLQMISGSPRLRRQYFDRLLIQLSREYFASYSGFHHILKQRNALLKRISMRLSQPGELDIWDEPYLKNSQSIWNIRAEYIAFLKENLSEIYSSISDAEDDLKIESIASVTSDLLLSRDRDIYSGSSSVGPHHDDFKLYLNGKNLSEFGSRGEQRTAVLALKIAQIRYIEKNTGKKPILLLDDVFSELDASRQTQLCRLVESYQTIITSCSMENVKNLKNAKIYMINAGTLVAS